MQIFAIAPVALFGCSALRPAGGTQRQDHFLHMPPFLLFISRLTGYSDHHRGEMEMRERLVPVPVHPAARTLLPRLQTADVCTLRAAMYRNHPWALIKNAMFQKDKLASCL